MFFFTLDDVFTDNNETRLLNLTTKFVGTEWKKEIRSDILSRTTGIL